MKFGVITDGISRDLEEAIKVMREYGLNQAELQYVWDKEVGDHGRVETKRIADLLERYQMQGPCISRHNFVGCWLPLPSLRMAIIGAIWML